MMPCLKQWLSDPEAEDKRERRRKLGLPEDPNPEELAKEVEAAAEKKRQAEAAKLRLPVKPVGGGVNPVTTFVVTHLQANGRAS